jgi:cysteinyl-tRNA synthetase, unknown class
MTAVLHRLLPNPIRLRIALAYLLAICSVISIKAATPKSFAYVLQADALAETKAAAVVKLAQCERDWIVLDATFSSEQPWLPADLKFIRNGKSGRKVIAYLSIGEAEDYRPYWQREWDANKDGRPDMNAPAFLLAENPDWHGNYRVKYWRAEWQKLMLATVDRIMAQGFDGLYLDIVDGFEPFEFDGKNYHDDRLNPETKQTYRRDMVDWVKAIAARARSAKASALILPQNGAQLLAHADFVSTVDGIGIEDLFSNGNKLQPASHSQHILESLKPLLTADKPVLDIEYVTSRERQAFVRGQAARSKLILLLTDRELKTLRNPGN